MLPLASPAGQTFSYCTLKGSQACKTKLPENLSAASIPLLQTSSLDLLVPYVGELAGGTLREERLDRLTNRLRELEMCEEHYGWSAHNTTHRYTDYQFLGMQI